MILLKILLLLMMSMTSVFLFKSHRIHPWSQNRTVKFIERNVLRITLNVKFTFIFVYILPAEFFGSLKLAVAQPLTTHSM